MIALVIVLFILTACVVSLPGFSRKQKTQHAKTLEYQANGERAAKEAGIDGLRRSERYWAQEQEKAKNSHDYG